MNLRDAWHSCRRGSCLSQRMQLQAVRLAGAGKVANVDSEVTQTAAYSQARAQAGSGGSGGQRSRRLHAWN